MVVIYICVLCHCYIICIIFMRIVCIKYKIDHNLSAMLLYHVNTSNICPWSLMVQTKQKKTTTRKISCSCSPRCASLYSNVVNGTLIPCEDFFFAGAFSIKKFIVWFVRNDRKCAYFQLFRVCIIYKFIIISRNEGIRFIRKILSLDIGFSTNGMQFFSFFCWIIK